MVRCAPNYIMAQTTSWLVNWVTAMPGMGQATWLPSLLPDHHPCDPAHLPDRQAMAWCASLCRYPPGIADMNAFAASPHHKPSPLNPSLIDSLYAEALVLADEARSWFDRTRGEGDLAGFDELPTDAVVDVDGLFHWAGRHDPSLRIALSCESLRMTTRLMHVIAWLLLQRAIRAGELPREAAAADHHRLGPSPDCDPGVIAQLPDAARRLIEASLRLHERVGQLETAQLAPPVVAQPAVHALFDQLATRL